MRARRDREGAGERADLAQVRRRLDRPDRDTGDAACAVHEEGADRDEHDGHQEPSAHELQEREREEVEADVPAEQRIGDAEGGAVQPAEDRVPLGPAGQAEEQRRDEQEGQQPEREGQRARGRSALLDHRASRAGA